MKKLIMSFHLFDGEGAGTGGEGSASALLSELGMTAPGSEPKAKSADTETRIEYGKPKDNGGAGQVGADQPAAVPDIAAEFRKDIGKGGKYHDIYGQAVSERVQERFKNQRDLQGQVDQITKDLSPLFMNYNLKPGDFEGLKSAIENDEAFYRAGAEKAGIDVDQYRENLKLKADAERGRAITEAYEQQQRQNEMFAGWERDAAVLQQSFPNFDLGMEIQTNDKFAKLIDNGMDVVTAFYATRLPEILNGQSREVTNQATQRVVGAIQQRAARPPEAAMGHQMAIQRKADPSQLTDKDMDEIYRRVQNGESFSF